MLLVELLNKLGHFFSFSHDNNTGAGMALNILVLLSMHCYVPPYYTDHLLAGIIFSFSFHVAVTLLYDRKLARVNIKQSIILDLYSNNTHIYNDVNRYHKQFVI